MVELWTYVERRVQAKCHALARRWDLPRRARRMQSESAEEVSDAKRRREEEGRVKTRGEEREQRNTTAEVELLMQEQREEEEEEIRTSGRPRKASQSVRLAHWDWLPRLLEERPPSLSFTRSVRLPRLLLAAPSIAPFCRPTTTGHCHHYSPSTFYDKRQSELLPSQHGRRARLWEVEY